MTKKIVAENDSGYWNTATTPPTWVDCDKTLAIVDDAVSAEMIKRFSLIYHNVKAV